MGTPARATGAPFTVMAVGVKLFSLDLTSMPMLTVLPLRGSKFCQLAALTVPLMVSPNAVAAQFQVCMQKLALSRGHETKGWFYACIQCRSWLTDTVLIFKSIPIVGQQASRACTCKEF